MLVMALFIAGCKKDKMDVENPSPVEQEEELITTLKLTFSDASGVETDKVFKFVDLDGDGGNAPIVDDIELTKNVTYNVDIEVLNESENPAEDITAEILAENSDHLFCFSASGIDLSINRTDSDGKYEVGLKSEWITGIAASGTVTVALKHQPGVKNGMCNVGETDIEVSFKTIIQ